MLFVPNRHNTLGIKELASLCKLSFYGLRNLWPKKYDFLVFSSSERRKSIGGYKQDRVVEGILSNYNALLIENPFPQLDHPKANEIKNKNVISESIFYFLAGFLSLFVKIEIEGKRLLNDIEDRYEIKIPIKPLARRYAGQRVVANLMIKLFKPKAVFFVYSASAQGYVRK